MKKVLSIILGILAILAIIIIVSYIYKLIINKKEPFNNPMDNVRKTECDTIIDVNYSEYSHLSTSVNPNPEKDLSILLLLPAFCFKSEGFTREQWKPEYNNVIEIIKKEIPIRTSPEVHNISGLLTEEKIRNAITKDIEAFKALSLDKLVQRKITSTNTDQNVIVGPVYIIFIQNPYYIEHNTVTGEKYYKNIYFNNIENKDYTSSYAVYNDGKYDFSKTINANVKTQLLLLYPMYDKHNIELYKSGCEYYNLKQVNADTLNRIKIKGNPSLSFDKSPSFAGISTMLRYFKSLCYIDDLKYCETNSCDESELKNFTLNFKLSNDNNCFIKCKGSLKNANTDLKDITCGCASHLLKNNNKKVTLNIPKDQEYETLCKSDIDNEIENKKYYIYGFAYRLNENLVVNDPLSRLFLDNEDVAKLNKAINPEKQKSKNGIEMLKLVNQCN